MSTLSVSNITSPTNTTPLVLSSANSEAAFVRIEAANNDIVFNGFTKFLGGFSTNSINVAYDTTNSAFASINSNWTVTNTVYGVANAAFAAANNVGPQLAPAYNTANAAFDKANSALQNTSGTFAGNLSVSGNVNLSLGTSALIMPKGTTAQRPSGTVGMVRFNTTTDALENYTSASGWIKVSIPVPTLSSISGTIYNGFASTLTLSGTNFGSSANVTFRVSGSTVATSTVTPSGGGTSISLSVPLAVYGQSVSTTVSITVTNDDGAASTGVDKTVTAMPSGGTVTTSGNYRIHAF